MGGGGEESGCLVQVVGAAGVGAVIGGVFGSINAAWVVNPQVKDQTGPMFKMTANLIKSHAALVATVGGVYAVTQCTAKALNGGEESILTKMAAGCASGAVLGVQSKRPSVGAGACAAFAAMAAAVHLAGGQLAPDDRKNNDFFRQWSRNSGEHHEH